MGRLADAIERVTSVASEVVVEAVYAVRARDTDDGFVGERAEGVVEEGGQACGVTGFGLAAESIVRKRNCRSTIRVDCVGKVAPVVVGVIGCYATRPDATRELAVRGVGVGRALAIGIDFVGHRAGGDVVEPGGCITRCGRIGNKTFAEGCHRGLVAEDIVSITHRICCTIFQHHVSTEVVFIDRGVTKRIGDGGKIAERVVGVGRAVAERVDGSGTLATGVVFDVMSVAATICVGYLATE